MLLSPKHPSLVGGLLRLVAGWVVAILLMQGFAASHERALGPVHHHLPQRALNLSSHGSNQSHEQDHTHGADERHYHAPDDSSVQASANSAAADDAWDAAASALVVAFALLAMSRSLHIGAAGRHVWRPARAWACLTAAFPPPLKPPRRPQPRT
jgi:hypothetical protein